MNGKIHSTKGTFAEHLTYAIILRSSLWRLLKFDEGVLNLLNDLVFVSRSRSEIVKSVSSKI